MRQTAARFDIEAMRGFAVLIVMLFHAGISPIGSGFIGVDVFFVISGYLIIGLLYREYERDGRIMLADFWGRRMRRLLPASTLVVGVTAAGALFFVNRLNLQDVRYDLAAAALYAANLRFGVTGSDYWATEYVSPVLHFWSLGVEEQFYIAIPILILLAHLLFWKVPMRHMPKVFRLLLIGTAIASLSYCLNLMQGQPVWGYYSTLSRAWEFALGGLAALTPTAAVIARGKLRRPLLLLLWIPLIWSAVAIDPKVGYPGLVTLVPVAATALILWAGAGSNTVGQALLSSRIPAIPALVAWLGGISYSAYLWHWPLLWAAAAYTTTTKQPYDVSASLGIPLLITTLLLAHLTKRFVEDPIRFRPELVRSSLRSLRLGVQSSLTAVAVVGVTALLPSLYIVNALPITPTPEPSESETIDPDWLKNDPMWLDRLIRKLVPPVSPNAVLSDVSMPLDLVRGDVPEVNEDNCHAERGDEEPTRRCTYGDKTSKKVIALFGDSHAAQFVGGLSDATAAQGYALWPRTRASCPAANVTSYLPENRQRYKECDTWRNAVLKELRKSHPDMVIISNQRPLYLFDRDTGAFVSDQKRVGEIWRTGMARTIKQLTEVGIHVMVIRDVPQWPTDLPECLATAARAIDCAMPTRKLLESPGNDIDIAKRIDNSIGIDLTSAICGELNCYPIRGNTVLARDRAHLTRTYSHVLSTLWQALIVHELYQPA